MRWDVNNRVVLMRYFPVKIVFLCILLTPVLYTGTLAFLEGYLGGIYQQKIENCIIGDSAPILDGSITIEEAVSRNIEAFIQQNPLIKNLGMELDILITAVQGKVIYPSVDDAVLSTENKEAPLIGNPTEIARRNFQLLSHDLKTKAGIRLPHGSMGANILLIIYIIISLSLFFIFYRISLEKARRHDIEKGDLISELLEEEKSYREKLEALESERKQIIEQYQQIKFDHIETSRQSSITENEMFEEIVALEERLNENMASQKQKEEEIERLKEELAREEKRTGGSRKRKIFDMTEKRFATIYKNVDVNRKALTGLFELSDEMQIKAEELIHQLNDDPSKVTIKRKVFAGKKNKTASFEVLFSYSGRLYFRNIEGNRIELLVIGSKNSQDKDMEFLHDLP